MSKRNGKWVVTILIALVLVISFFTWVIQERINENRGKPVPASEAE